MTTTEVRKAVVMFMDLVQSTDISVFQSPAEYDDWIREYQRTGRDVLKAVGVLKPDCTPRDGAFARIQGDEVCLILHSDRFCALGDVVENLCQALRIASLLKRRWCLLKRNVSRLSNNHEPLEVAVGIHYGVVTLGPDPMNGGASTPEGYCINLTKRVETKAREGTASRIYLSHHAFQALQDYFYNIEIWQPGASHTDRQIKYALRKTGSTEVKGLSSQITLYEVDAVFDESAEAIPVDKTRKPPTVLPENLKYLNELFDRQDGEDPDENQRATVEGCVRLFKRNPWDWNLGASLATRLYHHEMCKDLGGEGNLGWSRSQARGIVLALQKKRQFLNDTSKTERGASDDNAVCFPTPRLDSEVFNYLSYLMS